MARRTPHPGRRHRRHQHGRRGRRRVRERDAARRDPPAGTRDGLGSDVPGRLAVHGQDLPPQAGPPGVPGAARVRREGRVAAVLGAEPRPDARAAARPDRPAVPRPRQLRRPADAVPGRRHRSADVRARSARTGVARGGDASHDGDPGRVHAGQHRAVAARRRRRPQQHPRRRDAGHGRGCRGGGQCGHRSPDRASGGGVAVLAARADGERDDGRRYPEGAGVGRRRHRPRPGRPRRVVVETQRRTGRSRLQGRRRDGCGAGALRPPGSRLRRVQGRALRPRAIRRGGAAVDRGLRSARGPAAVPGGPVRRAPQPSRRRRPHR